MEEFIVKKSKEANVPVTIRFPEDMHNNITCIINELNQGLETKAYSYNGFVISACEYALKNFDIRDTKN